MRTLTDAYYESLTTFPNNSTDELKGLSSYPDAAYKVIGYSRDTNDRFRIVVEQPFIFGREYNFEDYLHLGVESRVVNMFAEMGMEPVEGDTTTFANDKYYVKDVHYGNVIEQKDGKLVIIDANATYNEGYKRELFHNDDPLNYEE